jgi:hypothetical protein
MLDAADVENCTRGRYLLAMRRLFTAPVLVTALVACEENRPLESDATTVARADVRPGPVSMRRLTHAQYHRSIADLFGDGVVVPDLLEPDVPQGGLLSVGAGDTTFSARGVASMEDAAYAIAAQVLDDEAQRRRLVPCAPAGPVDSACARQFVEQVGRSAWRRPLTGEEVQRITAVADGAAGTLGDFHAGLEYAVAALLQSPNFVFRVELGAGEGEARRFDDFELASRLSFFLWNSTPDARLLDQAAAGALSTDAGLLAEAKRLLVSPRAREGLSNFFSEQLLLYELDELSKDPMIFEHFSTELGADAREETLQLLLHTVLEADSDFRDIMTTRETFLNPRLSALYDVPAPTREGFRRVRLPEEANRAGLLTHASILNLHAHQVSSSATLRGKFVRTVLLCQTIPPPPVNVDTSIPEASGTARTLRDRVKEHLENPSCAGCHNLLDPIGLALENYDGIGRWRTDDNDARIDASGELDGIPYTDAIGLGQTVRDHEDFAPCVVRTLVRYATGRVEDPSEGAALEALSERFAEVGHRVRPMLLEIVMSPLFRQAGAPR